MLERIDPKKVIKTVSSQDPSIDTEASDMDKFEKTHNISYLKFKEGETPTYFILKNVMTLDQAKIQQEHYKIKMPDTSKLHGKELAEAKPTIEQVGQSEMMIKYFSAACEEIEENGTKFAVEPNMFSFAIIQEIGGFIMVRTAVGDDEKKLLES